MTTPADKRLWYFILHNPLSDIITSLTLTKVVVQVNPTNLVIFEKILEMMDSLSIRLTLDDRKGTVSPRDRTRPHVIDPNKDVHI
jgi:hypothetical protein